MKNYVIQHDGLQLQCKTLYGYTFDIFSEVEMLITIIEYIKELQGLGLALEGLCTKLSLLGPT